MAGMTKPMLLKDSDAPAGVILGTFTVRIVLRLQTAAVGARKVKSSLKYKAGSLTSLELWLFIVTSTAMVSPHTYPVFFMHIVIRIGPDLQHQQQTVLLSLKLKGRLSPGSRFKST